MASKILLTLLLVASSCLLAECGKPWEPEARTEDWWLQRHAEFVEYSRTNGSNIRIVFTGSSSIEHWSTDGKKIFDAKYAPMGTVNYGIGGDRIEHLLWRVQNGELDNTNPKMVVIYCGSNNIPGNPSNDEIVRGVAETIQDIANRLPETKILYVGFNPRGDVGDVEGTWTRIQTMNDQVRALYINSASVKVFDFFDDLILSWGQLNDELYLGDKLHLSEKGYEVWDSAWNTTFFELLDN